MSIYLTSYKINYKLEYIYVNQKSIKLKHYYTNLQNSSEIILIKMFIISKRKFST